MATTRSTRMVALVGGALLASAGLLLGVAYGVRAATAPVAKSRNRIPGREALVRQQHQRDDAIRHGLVQSAQALERQGRLQEAARAYRAAADTGTAYSPELERIGSELQRLGDAAGARRAYEEGAERGDRGGNRCAYRLAVLAADAGDYAGAVRRYRAAKEERASRVGGSGRAALPFLPRAADMDALKAACWSDMGQTLSSGTSQKAFPYYRESVRLAPDEPWQAVTYLGLASGYVGQEKLEEAVAAARKANALAHAGSDEALIWRAARKAESLQALVRSREMGRRLQSGWKSDLAPVPGVGDKNRPEFRVRPRTP